MFLIYWNRKFRGKNYSFAVDARNHFSLSYSLSPDTFPVLETLFTAGAECSSFLLIYFTSVLLVCSSSVVLTSVVNNNVCRIFPRVCSPALFRVPDFSCFFLLHRRCIRAIFLLFPFLRFPSAALFFFSSLLSSFLRFHPLQLYVAKQANCNQSPRRSLVDNATGNVTGRYLDCRQDVPKTKRYSFKITQ